jgi:hypothetical protein
VAIWAKSKNLGGRGLLRKAAILNRVRLSGWLSPRVFAKQGQLLMGKSPNADIEVLSIAGDNKEVVSGEADSLINLRRHTKPEPLPPSPLGVSNYDALDEWPSYLNDEDEDNGGQDFGYFAGASTGEEDIVYSDFNFFDPDPQHAKDEEYDDPFAVLPSQILNPARPPSPPDEPFRKMLKEQERSGSFRFFTIP